MNQEGCRRKVWWYIKVNYSSVKCGLFDIKIHKTTYMFRPAAAIIRSPPTLLENTLHACYTYVLYRHFLLLTLKVNYVRVLK
jgi:hypothetical protein